MIDNYRYMGRVASIGQRIKAERNKLNLTQEQLAEEIEKLIFQSVGQNTIATWENGKVLPPLPKLIALAELFGCDVSYLLCDYDQRTRDISDISQLTGLSGPAADFLLFLRDSPALKTIDILLSDKRFRADLLMLHQLSERVEVCRQLEESLSCSALERLAMNSVDENGMRHLFGYDLCAFDFQQFMEDIRGDIEKHLGIDQLRDFVRERTSDTVLKK